MLATASNDRRNEDLLLAEPEQVLADRLQLGEFAEHQGDAVLDTTVRILLEPPIVRFDVADRHGQQELPTARLLLERLHEALPEHRKLHLAHRALHAKQ
ncbi:hypothetical protein MesoLj113a_73000 [Mesorhizobium sp. 113-1-2]|uniref:hypothetical protein n=1 Tax=Mesorhizobium sp. 113-1-2 TaxID=2744515 RepID=UPI001938C928|nr:hypothetical protein [Mesorhizobium sp. 113-1-2]BCG76142.1 hypothetical protein MesoLj113a_73000 [Mesorhizobium sp. 113-1-2]